jgi:hypothetical protein
MIFASLHDYLPLDDLLKIVVACLAVAVIAPSAAGLVITGFEQQSNAQRVGVLIIAAMIAAVLYTLINR